MTNTNESLDIHPIFGALTRPAMKGGVTLGYHGLNIMVSMTALIALGSPLYLLMYLPIHAFGWLVCRDEPRYFEMVFNRLKNIPNSPNQFIWGVRSYEPF
jgi:type IV secretion system protein VirB3